MRQGAIKEVEDRRAILDPWSLSNIISLSVLDAVGKPRERIMRQFIEISAFGGNYTCILGLVNLILTVGLIRAAYRFHVNDSQTTYHLLLGGLWIYCQTVSFTYH